VFLKSGADVVSPWHDVPLYADASGKVLNFICEIPKETKAKVRCGYARRRLGTVTATCARRSRDVPLTPLAVDGGGHGRDAHAYQAGHEEGQAP
jgi:hypothetical protein